MPKLSGHAAWLKAKEQGFFRFIVFRGLLIYGVIGAITFVLLHLISGSDKPLTDIIAQGATTFGLGGLFFGVFLWHILKYKHENK